VDYGRLALDEIKNGYRFDEKADAYVCIYCEKAFQAGQVFSIEGKFYAPENAAAKHNETKHGSGVEQLIYADTKYNTLTEKQRELLLLFHSNMPDAEIAIKLGVSSSTVRHQKFTFREKAKQAKLYLAIFESVFDGSLPNEEAIIPIHNNAIYYDDRYVITEQEKTHILETFFESMRPLRLKAFSPKEKNKVVILAKIAEQFKVGEKYAEKEVNQILKPIFGDYQALRRYLIMYGFMERTKDGSSYWLA
jgi:hypothetical protein